MKALDVKRYVPFQIPGVIGGTLVLAVLIGHVTWRSPEGPDTFSVVALALFFLNLGMAIIGTAGRAEAEKDPKK